MNCNRSSNDYHFFSTSNQVSDICKDIFKIMPLNFFAYGKFYKNGYAILLTTMPKLYKHCILEKYPFTSPVPKQLISNKFIYLLDEDGDYKQAIADTKQLFGVNYPIDIISVHDDYYEMFCFGSNINKYDIVNTYLNNIESMHKFCDHFKILARNLILSAEPKKIYLPLQMQSNIMIDYEESRLSIALNKNNIKRKNKIAKNLLSPREIECIKQIYYGLSIKEVAKYLYISPRTVEYYLEMAKSKLNCKSRKTLVYTFIKNYGDIPY